MFASCIPVLMGELLLWYLQKTTPENSQSSQAARLQCVRHVLCGELQSIEAHEKAHGRTEECDRQAEFMFW